MTKTKKGPRKGRRKTKAEREQAERERWREFAQHNRESWLDAFVQQVRPLFVEAGFPLPKTLHVSVGFPSRNALRGGGKTTIGQCWSGQVSEDGNPHLFVSPLVSGAFHCGEIMVHELAHSAVGTECGHRGPFRRCALAVGLEGKMTSTVAGEELKQRLNDVAELLGPYPHPALNAVKTPRKGSRLRLLECACHPPRKIRLSRKVEEQGDVICGVCREAFAMLLEGDELLALLRALEPGTPVMVRDDRDAGLEGRKGEWRVALFQRMGRTRAVVRLGTPDEDGAFTWGAEKRVHAHMVRVVKVGAGQAR